MTTKELLDKIISLTHDMGNFELEFQPQRGYYRTVKEELADVDMEPEFPNEEERQRCFDTNSLVVFTWHNRTPVGAWHLAASNMDSLLAFVAEFIETNIDRLSQ